MDLGLVKYVRAQNMEIGGQVYCSVIMLSVLFFRWPNVFSLRWYILGILHEKESSDPEIVWLDDEIDINN